MLTKETEERINQLVAEKYLYPTIKRALVNEDDALDMYQEVWMKAISWVERESRATPDTTIPREVIKTILRKAYTWKFSDLYRKKNIEVDSAAIISELPANDDTLEKVIKDELMGMCIANLSKRNQKVVLLKLAGLSNKQISQHTGITVDGVKGIWKRSKTSLEYYFNGEQRKLEL